MTKEEIDKLMNAVSVIEEMLPKFKDHLKRMELAEQKEMPVYNKDLYVFLLENHVSTRLLNTVRMNLYNGYGYSMTNKKKYDDNQCLIGLFVKDYTINDFLCLRGCGYTTFNELLNLFKKNSIEWE